MRGTPGRQLVAASLGPARQLQDVEFVLAQASQTHAEAIVLDGPNCANWEGILQRMVQEGWETQLIDFVTTEFGEASARRRRGVVGTLAPIAKDVLGDQGRGP